MLRLKRYDLITGFCMVSSNVKNANLAANLHWYYVC